MRYVAPSREITRAVIDQLGPEARANIKELIEEGRRRGQKVGVLEGEFDAGRLAGSRTPMAFLTAALTSLDDLVFGLSKHQKLIAPLAFPNLPPEIKNYLYGKELLWDNQAAPSLVERVNKFGRVLYVQSDQLIEDCVERYLEESRILTPGSLPPFYMPWPNLEFRCEEWQNRPWEAARDQNDNTPGAWKFIELQSRPATLYANEIEELIAVTVHYNMRWRLRQGDEPLTEWSPLLDVLRVTTCNVNTWEYTTDIPNDSGMVRPLLGVLATLHLLNHRATELQPTDDTRRPMNRQQRRAEGYVEREHHRVVLRGRKSVGQRIGEAMRYENVVFRSPHWVRPHRRWLKASGKWSRVVMPHQRGVKHLTEAQRAAVRPKDFDASSALFHAAHDD